MQESESATFSGSDQITNIIARVTGGPSSIDGTIRSTIEGANLYFLNPQGIVFKSNAALEVSGSVTISTADTIHFSDKSIFKSGALTTEGLTSAPVSAFGFLTSKPAPVSFAGAYLARTDAAGRHVVAGDVTFDEGDLGSAGLVVPGGALTIFSAASRGTVAFDPANPGSGYSAAKFAAFGTVKLANATQVGIDSDVGGGHLVIRAGKLIVAGGSSISSLNYGADRGGDVQITADYLSIADSASIEASPAGGGPGGNLTIKAGSLQMGSGAELRSISTDGTGRAGTFTLNVDGAAELRSGARIKATSSSENANGALTIRAGSLLVDGNGTDIRSDRGSDGPTKGMTFAADPGPMRLAVRGELRITHGGMITATTTTPGAAANLEISASRLEIDGRGFSGETGIRADVGTPSNVGSPDATGHGGDLSIRTGDLTVIGRGFISASTFGFGDSGKLSIHAQGSVELRDGGSISAATYASGDASGLRLTAGGGVELRNGGVLVSATQGVGNAGELRVETPNLLIDGRGAADGTLTGLIAQSRNPKDGRPGSITVQTSALTMLGGAVIEATTGSANDAGSVSVTADRILLDGRGAAFLPDSGLPLATAISARTLAGSTGNGGNVSVVARDSITLLNRGEIEAATESRGAGGNVQVRAGRLDADGASFGFPSGIVARGAEGSTGAAGDVRVEVSGILTLTNRAAIASNNLGTGAAGNVRISAGNEVALTDGATISVASRASDAGTLFVGSAGKIAIESGSDITASAGANGGNIFLQARDLLYLSNSRIVAEAGTVPGRTGAAGIGGNISIDPEFIILDHSTISANADLARGGNVLLQAQNFLSSVTAITATGSTAGTVEIAAPELDLSAALAILAASLVDASIRLQERCTMRLGVEASSFLALGRGGVEASPDEPQAEIAARVPQHRMSKVRPR